VAHASAIDARQSDRRSGSNARGHMVYGAAPQRCYGRVMFGRVLFALVWLIIAAGVALPLYPRDLPTSTVAVTTDPVQLAAGTDAFGCVDCPAPEGGRADCRSDCRCGEAQPAVFVPLEEPIGVTIAVTDQSLPSRLPEPQPLPPKLPAI
jgi:hypothetical protein